MSNLPDNAFRLMAGNHPVVSGENALGRLEHWLIGEARGADLFILGDENTLDHCLPELLAHVPALRDAETMQVRSGERSKDLEVCRALWSHLPSRLRTAMPCW
jgi:3-dehydroquinate synthetase